MMNYLKKTPHRNMLERELKVVLPLLSGTIIDIGSQNRRYDSLMKTRPIAVDLVANTEKDVLVGDVTKLEFPDAVFDNVVCLEVLEYVGTPEKAASEIHRILRPGGTLVLSVPFMYKTHDDRMRYTENHLRGVFRDFSSVDIRSIGNAYTVILDIIFSAIKHVRFAPLRYLATIFYLPFALFIPNRISRKTRHPSGYVLIAKK